jgi:AcrR family transcriptional regulator
MLFQRRSPQQARGQATVDAILEGAARIIRREGPEALTTNRIAEVAGVSIGTLYGYFPDKTAVLVGVARRQLAEDEAAILAALADTSEPDPVRALVRVILELHRTDRAMRRAVMSVHLGLGLGGELVEQTQRVAGRLVDGGERWLGSGVRRPDPLQLFVVTQAVLGVARALLDEGQAEDILPADLEDELVRLVRAYLGETGTIRLDL